MLRNLYLFSAVSLGISGCQPCDNPVCLNYQPRIIIDKNDDRRSSVELIQIDANQSKSIDKNLLHSGKKLLGESKFYSGFNNYNIAARKQASSVGADKVVIFTRSAGKAHGDRMVLAGRTDPTVGLTTTNNFGTATSSIFTPYGNSYGTANYSGIGVTTSYNPGQNFYMREQFIYENLEYTIRFYGSD